MHRLIIKGLSKTYPNGVQALNDISLSIGNGMFGLLGPNGAGKSSLMRTLATLQPPDNGQVFFDTQDIYQSPSLLRSQLGYLPQDFGVYPKFSAMELLHHMALLKGIVSKADRKEQVLALLNQTNLYAVRKQSVSTFSGGMRQRFGIAQALLGNPQLLIVDEPTAGLDPMERNRFYELLAGIGENIVVLLSTHIVEDVHDLCPDMAVMANGRIILRGKPSGLTRELDGRIWRKTISRSALSVYQQTMEVIATRMNGGRLQVHVLSESSPGEGFEPFTPTLEDVYFTSLTGAKSSGKELVC
ncbi:ABC transporter ATP-binding protein [Pseudobacter ginsenosidimutans]|jgi:ABC-type multidrug transport system ATPase subunit|uniref:ABC-type multidrug transport system ATPase subunit n=1 Tax=Pseudobacter ginsenosidimutans TaxID=661488 RepID=A0A4Q7N5H7_9BACT|nr:ABC transporter ATP-binding protein [Pseudobacter ginsenosidimutans]QEC44766.1 ABC transporter ATP-binding protein [Pseudobacter ginsenosidimutans]RZS76250.1 ABC-type multidrug transport system ATPase subunit [Pseudobacter ginsenosidimutans]